MTDQQLDSLIKKCIETEYGRYKEELVFYTGKLFECNFEIPSQMKAVKLTSVKDTNELRIEERKIRKGIFCKHYGEWKVVCEDWSETSHGSSVNIIDVERL